MSGQRFGNVTYGQHGEDLFLCNLMDLLGVKEGSYLDIGAHHPVEISNTKLLYDRGFRGVNVEANINLMPAFHKWRPADLTISIAIVPVDMAGSDAIFYMYDDTSGRNTLSEEEVAAYGGTVRTKVSVQATTLQKLKEQCFVSNWPDLLNIDIEGLDYKVLAETEFEDAGPKVICVECRKDQGKEMEAMLVGKGYRRLCRIGENVIFVRVDLWELVL